MRVEEHAPKTTPAQRRAIIEHEDLTLEIGKLRPKLREMETKLDVLNAKLAAEAAASHTTAAALTTPEMPSTLITGKRTRGLEGEL